MNLILGAGLAGLSSSYHLGHDKCLVLEKSSHTGGHVYSRIVDGFTWDEGPHVSFTKHQYVRKFFAESVDDEFSDYPVRVGNYYHGHWIDHPAQCSLHQVPEPLRTECFRSFLDSRPLSGTTPLPPKNYAEWLEQSLGPVFAREFSEKYTRKYWTVDAEQLTAEWVGGRVYAPSIEDVQAGYDGTFGESKHYIMEVRYPKKGGYNAYTQLLRRGCNVELNSEVTSIDLNNKCVATSLGKTYAYNRLINTLPLPVFIKMCRGVPANVVMAAKQLLCTQLLLVNVRAKHPTMRPENWMYVYDEDKFSTRIHCVEKLTPGNAPKGWTGIQVEVYSNPLKPLPADRAEIGGRVVEELIEMGLIAPENLTQPGEIYRDLLSVQWANPVFTFATEPALKEIWAWLETYGLYREPDDLYPLTKWTDTPNPLPANNATLFMAGRFGQWKYFWSDDCVLRGRHLAAAVGHSSQESTENV